MCSTASSIVDHYRWLEGDNTNPADQGKVTPEVAAWTDAQNPYTRAVLDNLPGRAALEDAAATAHGSRVGVGAPRAGEPLFLLQARGQPEPAVVYWREGLRARAACSSIPRRSIRPGLTTVEWISPSPDGRTLAYGTYRAGDENTTLHLLDVDTGKTLPLEIPNKTQAPDWLPDGSGFVYQNLKDPKDPYSGQVMFHRMGRTSRDDVVLFRQFTEGRERKARDDVGTVRVALARRPLAAPRLLGRHEVQRSLARRLRAVSSHRPGRTARGIGRQRGSGVRHGHRRHAVSADDEGRAERARRRGEHRRRPRPPTGATSCPSGRTP